MSIKEIKKFQILFLYLTLILSFFNKSFAQENSSDEQTSMLPFIENMELLDFIKEDPGLIFTLTSKKVNSSVASIKNPRGHATLFLRSRNLELKNKEGEVTGTKSVFDFSLHTADAFFDQIICAASKKSKENMNIRLMYLGNSIQGQNVGAYQTDKAGGFITEWFGGPPSPESLLNMDVCDGASKIDFSGFLIRTPIVIDEKTNFPACDRIQAMVNNDMNVIDLKGEPWLSCTQIYTPSVLFKDVNGNVYKLIRVFEYSGQKKEADHFSTRVQIKSYQPINEGSSGMPSVQVEFKFPNLYNDKGRPIVLSPKFENIEFTYDESRLADPTQAHQAAGEKNKGHVNEEPH